jgi:biotin-dependent carboxylase-like uncharacterized protein
MRAVLIHNHGLLTTIQDLGRTGYRRFGMPVSGAMDSFAFRCANLLLGNPENSPALEATLLGPEIEFLAQICFSITGSDFEATLDNKIIKGWETNQAGKGSILKIGSINKGVRIYIAFEGGISTDPVLSSASTYLQGKIGGYKGRPVRKDDILMINKGGDRVLQKKIVPGTIIPLLANEKIVRILPGVNYESFSADEVDHLLNSAFSVTPNCDRMGLRLEGKNSPLATAPDIISCGIHFGAIQVPGDGNPIIMGTDAQTIGGYRQFANIITADLGLVAQMLPGDLVRFKLTDRQNAVSLLNEREAIIEKVFGKQASKANI